MVIWDQSALSTTLVYSHKWNHAHKVDMDQIDQMQVPLMNTCTVIHSDKDGGAEAYQEQLKILYYGLTLNHEEFRVAGSYPCNKRRDCSKSE